MKEKNRSMQKYHRTCLVIYFLLTGISSRYPENILVNLFFVLLGGSVIDE